DPAFHRCRKPSKYRPVVHRRSCCRSTSWRLRELLNCTTARLRPHLTEFSSADHRLQTKKRSSFHQARKTAAPTLGRSQESAWPRGCPSSADRVRSWRCRRIGCRHAIRQRAVVRCPEKLVLPASHSRTGEPRVQPVEMRVSESTPPNRLQRGR